VCAHIHACAHGRKDIQAKMSRGDKQEKRPEKGNTSSGKLVFKQDWKPGRIQLAHSQPHARQHCRPQHTGGALGRRLQKTPLIAHAPRALPYHTTVRALPYHTPLRSEQCHWQPRARHNC
jgi:hypothetical protein